MFENDLSPPLPSNITKQYETKNAKRKENLPGKLELQMYVKAPVAFFVFLSFFFFLKMVTFWDYAPSSHRDY